MLGLLTAILASSLLGSAHCAGMCGAFLTMAVVDLRREGVSIAAPRPASASWVLHAGYHAGRLLTYVAFGAAAGGVGSVLDVGGAIVGVQRTAAVLAGVAMIVVASVALLRHGGVIRASRGSGPAFLRAALGRAHARVQHWPGLRRALAVGLLTTLLPCGWLYAFVVIAAGTGSPLWGMAAMGAFWVGTLPLMMTLGVGIQKLSGPLRARLPVLTSVLLLVMGLLTVGGRLAMPASPGTYVRAVASSLDPADAASLTQLETLARQGDPVCHGQ